MGIAEHGFMNICVCVYWYVWYTDIHTWKKQPPFPLFFNTSLEMQVNTNFENRSYERMPIYQLNLQIRLIPWNKKEQDSPLKTLFLEIIKTY